MPYRPFIVLLLALLFIPAATSTAQSPLQPETPADAEAPGQWLHLIKSPDPLYVERGGTAVFTIVVLNTSDTFAMRDVVVTDPLVPDCELTIGALAAGQDRSYTCEKSGVEAAFTNFAQASGTNATNGKQDIATDTAVVEIAELSVDLQPTPTGLPEPGGLVSFSLLVRSTGTGSVQLTALTSPQFGDLTAPDNPLLQNNSCAGQPLPQLFPGGKALDCSFSAAVSAPPGPFSVTVNAAAVAGGVFPFQGAGTAVVTITDSPSLLEATLVAPRTRVPLGGAVDLDVTLTNASAVDEVTIVNMSDSELGDVTAAGSCAVPLTLAPGAQYSCRYRQYAGGPAGQSTTYTFSASGVNDDQPPTQVRAQAAQDVFVYQPLVFMPSLTNPLNDSCATALRIETNRTYQFLPAYADAWYVFTLDETADIVAVITNYVPRLGQMIIYSATDPTCKGLQIAGNDGSFTDVKRVELPASPPNRYYLRVFTDANLNDETPYTLIVRTR